MKILVPVKRVVDYNVKVQVKSDQTDVDIDNVKMSMNPFDEIAVEEAVRLQEAGVASETVAVSIGNAKSEETLRTAMAMGIDTGILVETDSDVQPLDVAKILAKLVSQNEFDLVIMGKQAIDDDSNQTGQMLAALLGWGQGTFASSIVVEDNKVNLAREVDDGIEHITLKLPAILTTDLRLNEPRYPALPNIMKARSKPLEKLSLDSLGVSVNPRLKIVKVEEPSKRSGGIKVETVDELVEILKSKGVI